MSDLIQPPDISPSINAGLSAVRMGPDATRAKIATTAKQFEATFLSSMLGSMFQGLSTDGMFGGGAGEQAFRSFLTDAMSKQMVSHGGVGLAPAIQKEMLRLQGLSETPQSGAGASAGAASSNSKSSSSKTYGSGASVKAARAAYAGAH